MRIQKLTILLGIASIACVVHVNASDSTQHQPSKYMGEENRSIKSLSASDIEELKNGSGWGLAKTAELNGVPGPAHLLELQDEIGLSQTQRDEIQFLFNNMKAEAITAGLKLI